MSDPQQFICGSCGHIFGVKKTLLIHEKTCGAGGTLVMQAGRWVGANEAVGGGGKGGKGKGKSSKGGKGKGKSSSKSQGRKGETGTGKSGKGSSKGKKGGKGGGGGTSVAESFGCAPASKLPQQHIMSSSNSKKAPPTAEPAPVAAGLSKKSENAVRQALQGTRDSADHFIDSSMASFVVSQKVHAIYVDDEGAEEWFDATVWEINEDGTVEVYYDDYDDEWATLNLEQLSAKEPKASHDSVTASNGKIKQQASRSTAQVPRRAAANPFKGQREGLPVFAHRQRLLQEIRDSPVVVIEGDTGCGKTTQVPQYVLEEASASGTPCSIICTQPRRISAMSIGDRVAAERGEEIGGTIGYSIRLESKTSASTALLFCTTGILMRRLEESTDLCGVTHIFVDEVHERSMESDFLLMVLRDLLQRRADLRLVLMSATLNAGLFARYFSAGTSKVPIVSVPGRAFPVMSLFLEDALDLTQHRVRAGADWSLKVKGKGTSKGPSKGGGAGGESRQGDWTCPGCSANVFAGKSECFKCDASKASSHVSGQSTKGTGKKEMGPPDADMTPAELKIRYPRCSDVAVAALSSLDFDVINYELIVQLLQWLLNNACRDGPAAVAKWAEARRPGKQASQSVSAGSVPTTERGNDAAKAAKKKDCGESLGSGFGVEALGDAVLIFLPGAKEIQTLHEAILATREFGSEPQRSWVLPLHGLLPPEEQRRVFDRPPPGVRKVVISTNIAETAITIDDVSIVIDSCRMKEKCYDPAKRMESLDDVTVSRANAQQRRGRAGRTRPGVAIHLITSFVHDHVIAGFQLPEIARVPLERLVLTIKALKYTESAIDVCARLLEPPKAAAVMRAVRELVEIDALDVESGGETLTALGVHLSKLPVDVRIGKFILLGAIFGMVDETLTIAATLSMRSPFLSPFDKRDAADAAKRSFALEQSDHLAMLKAYTDFDQTSGQAKFEFARENFLRIKTLQSIAGVKRQLLELLSDAYFVAPGLRARVVEAMGRRSGGSDGVWIAVGADSCAAPVAGGTLLKALLCAALYPQVIVAGHEPPSVSNGKGGKKGGKPSGGGSPKFTIREDGSSEPVAVMIHPSSVNARETKFESKFLVYAEKVRTTQVYVRDCTPVSPYALMLFGGALSSDGRPKLRPSAKAKDVTGECILSIDSWIKFAVPRRIEELIFDVRGQLDSLLQKKLANPGLELSQTGKCVLDAVNALLASTPPK